MSIIAIARAMAVMEMVHQRPALPYRAAAQAATGMRLAVIAVDATIGIIV